MAQYEWVDVYSLKRWGDPSTEGDVDGIIGSGGGTSNQWFTWGQALEFSSTKFQEYRRQHTGANKTDSVISNNVIRSSTNITFYDDAWWSHSDFLVAKEFDRFSKLKETTLKKIQVTNLTTNYANWTIQIVLENGVIMASQKYAGAVSNFSGTLTMSKLPYLDTNYLGRLQIYPLDTWYSKVRSDGNQSGYGQPWEIMHTASTSNYNMTFQSLRFLNK